MFNICREQCVSKSASKSLLLITQYSRCGPARKRIDNVENPKNYGIILIVYPSS